MFNKMEIYQEKVAPLVNRISQICSLYQMPFFCSVCIRDDGKKTEYVNTMSPSISNGIALADDKILQHINVANGFITIPPTNIQDISAFDDIEDDLGDDPELPLV